MKVEHLVLALNLVCFLWYLSTPGWSRDPGKVLYWLGATILVIGLLKMKG